jgi:pectate lyase
MSPLSVRLGPERLRRPLAVGTTAILALAGAAAITIATGAPAYAAFETSPVGFASMNGGTTGGSGGPTVTVTSASQLDAAINSGTRQIVRISGMLSITGMHKVASNKTIQGVGSNSGFTGGGLTLDTVSNVIIRNLRFTNADDDSINLQESTHNVWIDHNDLQNGFDGLIDIKRGSDFVTVSWNLLHNHDKSMLLGHSDDNGAQDTGHLRVTYVHNFFNGTNQRHPRVRFANPVHVLNNYYLNIGSYGIASTENAGVLSERNYFENVATPIVHQTGDSADGNIRDLNSNLVNSGTRDALQTRNSGSVAAIPYSYTPDSAPNVKSIVTAGAGVGKLGL